MIIHDMVVFFFSIYNVACECDQILCIIFGRVLARPGTSEGPAPTSVVAATAASTAWLCGRPSRNLYLIVKCTLARLATSQRTTTFTSLSFLHLPFLHIPGNPRTQRSLRRSSDFSGVVNDLAIRPAERQTKMNAPGAGGGLPGMSGMGATDPSDPNAKMVSSSREG